MLIAVVSAKGSPGATTLALALAARWPRPGAVVVEADPAGGDILARFGRPPAEPGREPGLAAMALAGRAGRGDGGPDGWLQPTALGVEVIAAEPGTAAAASLAQLAGRGPGLLRALGQRHPAVLVDGGRWDPSSLANPLLAATDVALLVIRPVLEEVRQAEVRLAALRAVVPDVRLVAVGDGPWPPAEVAAQLRVVLAGSVPVDRDAAGLLAGRSEPRRGWSSKSWTRLPLLRACRGIALTLDASTPPAEDPPVRHRHPGDGWAAPAPTGASTRDGQQVPLR
ncbi:MAG TPA: hypothetical protein VF755_02425 [Catenuloplanes sp.]|jgi:hypothetical protein